MKKLLFIAFCSVINPSFLFSQGMPIDPKTGKVNYTESIEISDITKNDMMDRAANFVSGFSSFRGSINAVYVDKEKSILRCLMSINITESLKSTLNQVNAAVQIEFFEGRYIYSISNLFVVTTTVSSIYESENKDSPIENSKIFDITNFEKKNNNAKITNRHVTYFIESLKKYIDNPIMFNF